MRMPSPATSSLVHTRQQILFAGKGSEWNAAASKLTLSETLCLGPCHCRLEISPNNAFFLLGSINSSMKEVPAFILSLGTHSFYQMLW